jgi:hypothetical protein
MRAKRRIGAAAAGWPFLVLLLALSSGSAGADNHGSVSVSIGFGGYLGVPVMVGAGGYYYPAQYPYGVAAPGPYRPRYAFVDTDIHPEEAHVYLDGKLIGIADDFDGYPGYLAVKPGRHTLGFRHDGYHSLSFNLDLHAGEMIQIDRKMPKLLPGEKDEGLPPVSPRRGAREASPLSSEEGEVERSGSQGTLRLEVSPLEARVTLDGDFFGTGAEIGRLRGGIPLSPGVHRIRVSLAGYQSESAETEIRESEEQTLRISLKKQ